MRTMSVMICAIAVSAGAAFGQLELNPIGSYGSGQWDASAAEIPAYDAATKRLFVVNATVGVDVLDISNPFAPSKITTIALPGVNSVSVSNGVLAVAQQNATKTSNGFVHTYTAGGNFAAALNTYNVGALPDALTFTPDGTKLVVANEGEPNGDYSIDPIGSVSIIDLNTNAVTPVNFNSFNGTEAALNAAGVRISGPVGTTAGQDIEPEYVAISPDGTTAFVTLQENNAVAKIDLTVANPIPTLMTLGERDHSIPGQGIDANKNDDTALIENFPIFGLPMADAIDSYSAGGSTYYVTANEGDGRDYDTFSDEMDLSDATLDPAVFTDANFVTRAGDGKDIGDLKILNNLGVTEADGDAEHEKLYAYGSRSFSIYDENGNLVYDSKDDFETITAATAGVNFNATNDEQAIDDRSDNKGPEPEAVEIAEIDGKTYAFVGLERVGGFMVYDITDPANVLFDSYINPRDFSIADGDLESEVIGLAGTIPANRLGDLDLGPEGILFISAADSPTSFPLLIVANEVSGTTTIYGIPEPASIAMFGVAGLALLRRRRNG
jgi:DNA-binding beta-propeller fold protein YncE